MARVRLLEGSAHGKPTNFVILKAFVETIRSYYGFTCWIAMRIINVDTNMADECYLIDGIGLRAYLRGEFDAKDGIGKALF